MSVAVANSATKICTRCYRELPIDRFRFMRKDIEQRHPRCNDCANEYERQRRRRRSNKKVHGFTKAVIDQRHAQARATLVSRTIAHFGGTEGFAEAFWRAIESAKKDGRHCAVLRAYRVLLQLRLESETHSSDQVHTLSDEQLATAKANAIIDWIDNHESVAVDMLRHKGWTVTAPEETER